MRSELRAIRGFLLLCEVPKGREKKRNRKQTKDDASGWHDAIKSANHADSKACRHFGTPLKKKCDMLAVGCEKRTCWYVGKAAVYEQGIPAVVVRNTSGLQAHSGRVGVVPFTMRSSWCSPCVVAIEFLLIFGCVGALFTSSNVGYVARSLSAEEHHATSASTGTGTSASTGSMQRSSGFYFGEESRRSTWSSFAFVRTAVGCPLRVTAQANGKRPYYCFCLLWLVSRVRGQLYNCCPHILLYAVVIILLSRCNNSRSSKNTLHSWRTRF